MKKAVLFAGRYMKGFISAWEKYGYAVYTAREEFTKEVSEKNLLLLKCEIGQNGINIVFSFDYLPGLAEACAMVGIKYLSWIWDCPHTSLWHKSSRYSTTYIFLFDYIQYRTQLNRGISNVFYLPLSPDVDTFREIVSKDAGTSREKYGSDVSFLGNIYNDDKHNMYDKINYLPPYVKGYLDALMEAQRNIWGYSLIEEGIEQRIWDELKKYVMWNLGDDYEDGIYEPTMVDVINKKIAQNERKEMCGYLARHYDFSLYSGADTSFDPVIKNKGYAIYDKEMPLIFNYSKINIHITIRSITSGVPLRVMDVLACGGFLLTNYQPEIEEFFEDGKELVMYEDLQDLYRKISYYLEHEEERKSIALAGQKKVEEMFHYNIQVGNILRMVEE